APLTMRAARGLLSNHEFRLGMALWQNPPTGSRRFFKLTQTKTKHYVLSEETLDRFLARAPIYDRENRFFVEDFDELRKAGYLVMAVPRELGGLGKSLAGVCQEQRRLAYYAPATALAINMHLYWTGVAADLWRSGDKSLEWILKAAVQG